MSHRLVAPDPKLSNSMSLSVSQVNANVDREAADPLGSAPGGSVISTDDHPACVGTLAASTVQEEVTSMDDDVKVTVFSGETSPSLLTQWNLMLPVPESMVNTAVNVT